MMGVIWNTYLRNGRYETYTDAALLLLPARQEAKGVCSAFSECIHACPPTVAAVCLDEYGAMWIGQTQITTQVLLPWVSNKH